MRPALLPCTVVTAALALTACGSTVQNTGGGAGSALSQNGGSANEGLGTAPGTAQGAGPGGSGTTATGAGTTGGSGFGTGGIAGAVNGAGGTAGGTTSGGASGGTGSFGTSGTTTSGGGRLGPGVDAKYINVGIVYTKNGAAGNAAIGGGGISSSNEKDNADAVIAEINAHGGVAGRKLRAVYATYDATSSQPAGAQDQAACDALTKDNKIFAVTTSGLTDVFPKCMQSAGVTVLTSGAIIDQDIAKLREFPTLFQLGTLSQDRMMREEAKSLGRQQYYTGWNTTTGSASPATPTKVGILTLDDPRWTRPLKSILLPALKAAGHPVASADVQLVPMAHTTGDAGAQAQAVGNAVLRLRSDGVTHLVILDASATITIFFATAAKNQGYYPRIGANSATGMQALTDAKIGGNNIFKGAVGLGWFPSLDLPQADAVKHQGPATKKCLEIINRRTGQSLSSGNGASLALIACDTGYFLKAAADRAGGNLTQGGLVAAAESLGTSFTTALYGASRLGPDRHDALEPGYDMAWDTSCTCAKYVRSFSIP